MGIGEEEAAVVRGDDERGNPALPAAVIVVVGGTCVLEPISSSKSSGTRGLVEPAAAVGKAVVGSVGVVALASISSSMSNGR